MWFRRRFTGRAFRCSSTPLRP
uniref:Uncharacterized protein n=1 Tax=Romanomermis culicivorax TaxID=13658 RepID=A0A915K0S1_ROMCU